jgi:hypothetical protein
MLLNFEKDASLVIFFVAEMNRIDVPLPFCIHFSQLLILGVTGSRFQPKEVICVSCHHSSFGMQPTNSCIHCFDRFSQLWWEPARDSALFPSPAETNRD